MKRYRNIIILLTAFALCLFHIKAFAEEHTTGVNVVYLLDVSGSMKKGGLFENIKVRLKQLVDERNIGDRVALITFAEDIWKVLDVEIRSRQDIDDIDNVIGNLKAEGPWTWMSKAFQRTKDIAEDIKAKSPEKKIMIYLLTDCDNDPPPAVKQKEPPWKFVEVLTNYFKDFKIKDTNVYLLSYRPLEQDEKDRIKQETSVIVREPEASEPIPGRIVLAFSGFDFGEIDFSKAKVNRSGEVIIKKIEEHKTGEKIQLSSPSSFIVNPESIECKVEGQKEKISIIIPADLEPGKHSEVIKLSASNAVLEPAQIDFSFSVNKQSGGLWKWLLFVIVLMGAMLLIAWAVRQQKTKRLWIKGENDEVYEAFLRGQQKLWLAKHTTGEYLEMGLPTYFLTIGKKASVMLCEDKSGEKRRVDFTKDMRCELEGDKIVNLRFYELDPKAGSDYSKREETTQRPKGPMGRI